MQGLFWASKAKDNFLAFLTLEVSFSFLHFLDVVQNDEQKGYCATKWGGEYWGGKGVDPPPGTYLLITRVGLS